MLSAIRPPRTMSSPPLYKTNPLPRSLYPIPLAYKHADFSRQDESADSEWYAQPRFVQHIDDPAIACLKSYYSTIIKPNHSVLDICSSWVSHLPAELKPQSMVGYGMNYAELSKNPHLTKFSVKDLNVMPRLEDVPDGTIDTVICNVSVDYLTRPVEVFNEMKRVLIGGGTAHMAFSNRCFPTKVVGNWMEMSDEERRRWVAGYFWASGGWEGVEEVILKEQKEGFLGRFEDPLYVVRGMKMATK